ncbi:RNA pseudouridine synthase 6, chloroplastic-like [Chenopodium quinoa]|uniref:RNA pseudouridine synthase 6, chloroplastic-like n=1 Tax=Chenopodium quinoa TaxID=63459 RepID=UPI000B796A26|nr:RNA pseudouridine synthase 6, chloroplastic-like [Chenopodium quinoa]XP_021719666.1 RNA pseudouridine synthase 6, chloroplastic-like [Chenopodium quinoa]
MPGNPMSLGPSNFGPNFINTLFSSFRGTHFRLIGAPTTLRRTLAATHSISYNKLVRANINSPVSIFNSETVASSTIPSVNGYPEYSRLLPCPSTNLPPRIEHLVVLEKSPVCEYISKSLDLPPLYVADLIRFGAVYYALICPEPPVTATPEQVQLYQQFTSPELLLHRRSIKGKTFREAQKTFRVTRIEEFFEVGTYLRIHVHPKRFPRCYEIDWKSRILAVTESYVVLNKPAGTSVGGSSDNIEECCATFATRALGLTYPLLTTHQIDNCTEGCVVLARNKKYCSTFHKKIRDKMVKKLYLALAAAPVPRGIYTHYMRPFDFAPRLISEECIDRWLLCRLEVLDCKEVPWPNSSIREKYQIEDCGWPVKNLAYECTVDLLTGRTHQIRAQFAACGAPIIGDSMYMPASLAEKATPNINPLGKCKEEYTSEDEKNIAIDNWIALHGKEPTVAIGLQACQISWDNGEHIYNAGSPWWR